MKTKQSKTREENHGGQLSIKREEGKAMGVSLLGALVRNHEPNSVSETRLAPQPTFYRNVSLPTGVSPLLPCYQKKKPLWLHPDEGKEPCFRF